MVVVVVLYKSNTYIFLAKLYDIILSILLLILFVFVLVFVFISFYWLLLIYPKPAILYAKFLISLILYIFTVL